MAKRPATGSGQLQQLRGELADQTSTDNDGRVAQLRLSDTQTGNSDHRHTKHRHFGSVERVGQLDDEAGQCGVACVRSVAEDEVARLQIVAFGPGFYNATDGAIAERADGKSARL